MEKNRILNQSINQSPSLFDAPGTEALALRNLMIMTDILTDHISRLFTKHSMRSKLTMHSMCLCINWRITVAGSFFSHPTIINESTA